MHYPKKNKRSVPYLKVPADYIPEHIKKIADINRSAKYEIREVYGSLPFFTSSARPDHVLPPTTTDQFLEYLYSLNSHGIYFNYVINLPQKSRGIRSKIDFLLDLGISKFTVADPKIIQHLNRRGIEPTLSVTRDINNQAKLKSALSKHAVANICLSENLNRNIKILSKFVKEFPLLGFEIIVNSLCFQNCPNKKRHYKYTEISRPDKIDPYGSWCDDLKKRNLENVMNCCWVLPKDLASLESIQISCFKVAGRELINDRSYEYIKAYATGSYSGDLMSLLLLGNKTELDGTIKINTQNIKTRLL